MVKSIKAKNYALLLSPNNPTEAKENLSHCDNKTNYTRRHKFTTHKNNNARSSSKEGVITSHS